MEIGKNDPPSKKEIDTFLKAIKFKLPEGFIEFFKTSNGADIDGEEEYVMLWALTEMIELNTGYNVEEYAPEFFIFGSDGGGTAFAIERKTGHIFDMPFIGMSKEEATFKCNTFDEFLEGIE